MATTSIRLFLRALTGLAGALACAAALAQDVYSSGPQRRQPQPLETSRLCGRSDPGPYVIQGAPSCAKQIADGERRYGVRATFVTLRESREIPASWIFASPTGPCAEGESLVFFTDAGKQLFQRTATQCSEHFAGNDPPRRNPPTTRPAPAPAPAPATAPSPRPAYPTDPGGFACIDPPPDGRREQVRGLPGGALCELRQTDELWCRQRNALSYDPYLPTNPGWPMKPVGVRVLPDCTIVRIDPTAPPATHEVATEDTGYWKGVEDGLQGCGASVGVMLDAFRSMGQGDFVRAASLLGITDSTAALRGLWQEWTQTQVLDASGTRVSEYDKGKRQAERVCFYVLLPKAQSCALSGGKCALRAAARACSTLGDRVAQLRPRVPVFIGRKPPSPIFRGLLLPDEQILKQLAATENKVIIVRDSNQWSMRWIGRKGYAPKPLDVKGKTLKPEDLAGLPAAERDRYLGLASAKGMSLEERTDLLKKGYKIGSPGAQEVITGPNNERFYSDTDLHGVYNLDGTSGWSDALLQKLECHFFDRGVQHGPHDAWPLRNDARRAGPNYGPQVGNGKALTAYFPDGRSVHLTTLEAMKALYSAIRVDWHSVYPYH